MFGGQEASSSRPKGVPPGGGRRLPALGPTACRPAGAAGASASWTCHEFARLSGLVLAGIPLSTRRLGDPRQGLPLDRPPRSPGERRQPGMRGAARRKPAAAEPKGLAGPGTAAPEQTRERWDVLARTTRLEHFSTLEKTHMRHIKGANTRQPKMIDAGHQDRHDRGRGLCGLNTPGELCVMQKRGARHGAQGVGQAGCHWTRREA